MVASLKNYLKIFTPLLSLVPVAPAQSLILKSVNVTSVELDLRTWQIDECPVIFYSIKFQSWDETEWVEVMNSINWNTVGFIVSFYPHQPSFFCEIKISSGYPDQMPQYVASDQGLHCFQSQLHKHKALF